MGLQSLVIMPVWAPAAPGSGRRRTPQDLGRRFPLTRWAAFRSRAAAAGALVAALALSACAEHPQTTLQPQGPVARIELGLMAEGLWIMLGVFIVVVALLVYAMIRFRERPGDTAEPKQVEGNHLMEIAWTVIPFLLLVALAIPTFRQNFALAATPKGPDVLNVTVVGHQWWWEFDYPDLGIVTADEMHIPAGVKVNITLESADVLHSFWVPQLGGKEDTVPGVDNHLWLEADQPGTYPGQCAEFCGTSHTDMRLLVIAQSQSDFQAWAQQFQHPDSQPHSAQAQAGMLVFKTNCASCHTIDGSNLPPPTKPDIAPHLTDFSAHETAVAATLQNNPQDVQQWVDNAQKIMPDTIMPSFEGLLTPQQMADVTAYVEGLK